MLVLGSALSIHQGAPHSAFLPPITVSAPLFVTCIDVSKEGGGGHGAPGLRAPLILGPLSERNPEYGPGPVRSVHQIGTMP